MSNESILIDQVANGFIVKPFVSPDSCYTNDEVNVFNNHYDLYQFILTHFKLKPDEVKNEQ